MKKKILLREKCYFPGKLEKYVYKKREFFLRKRKWVNLSIVYKTLHARMSPYITKQCGDIFASINACINIYEGTPYECRCIGEPNSGGIRR